MGKWSKGKERPCNSEARLGPKPEEAKGRWRSKAKKSQSQKAKAIIPPPPPRGRALFGNECEEWDWGYENRGRVGAIPTTNGVTITVCPCSPLFIVHGGAVLFVCHHETVSAAERKTMSLPCNMLVSTNHTGSTFKSGNVTFDSTKLPSNYIF